MVLFLFGIFNMQLITALNVAPAVVPEAARYLGIRALAAPASTGCAVLSVRATTRTHA
jgi:Na+-driven multidrug efflux pump